LTKRFVGFKRKERDEKAVKKKMKVSLEEGDHQGHGVPMVQ
jgi:hypothetical protein